MKKITMLLIFGLTLSSCTLFNSLKVKEKASDLISGEFKKLQDKEFKKAEYAGMSCQYESTLLSSEIRDGVDDFLHVDRSNPKMLKSIFGDAAEGGCKLVINGVISKFAEGKLEKYPCTQKFVGVNFEKLSGKVCPLVKAKIDGNS